MLLRWLSSRRRRRAEAELRQGLALLGWAFESFPTELRTALLRAAERQGLEAALASFAAVADLAIRDRSSPGGSVEDRLLAAMKRAAELHGR